MGNTVSHCGGRKSRKKRKKPIKQNNNESENISDELDRRRDAVDGLRTKSGSTLQRVSQPDRELVETQIQEIEKRHGDLQARAARSQKKHSILGTDLEEIQDEVNTYVSWLGDKEAELTEDTPLGYSVKDAEAMLTKHKELVGELESRQMTLDNVARKVEALIQDLPRKERDMVEKWVSAINTDHQRVYGLAMDKQKLLAENIGHRELFQASLERVNMWLQTKERDANKLEAVRYHSSEAEKQLEKCKVLQSEILGYHPNIESLARQVKSLEADCPPERAAELQHKLTDVQSRYDDLKTLLATTQGRLKDSVATRKMFEEDVHKVEKWCKEIEMRCATEPCVDCAIEVLDDQYKQYKTLDNTSHMFESLVKEINQRGQSMYPTLYQPDKFRLDQTLQTTTDQYEKVDTLVKGRLAILESAIATRSQVNDEIEAAQEMLVSIHDNLRQANKPMGVSVEDAENALKAYEAIGEKMAAYQPSIAQLNQAVERIRNTGQNSEADEILQLTAQYELLEDQVEQQCRKCQQAIALRQQYADQKAAVQTMAAEYEQEIKAIDEQSLPLPVKVEKLKAVSEKVTLAEPMLTVLGDKAQQLSIESKTEDARKVFDESHTLRGELEQLKKAADRKWKQCEILQRNKDEYENTIAEAMLWLEQKEDILAACNPLDLEVVKVDQAVDKHKMLSKGALEKLDMVKDKAQLEMAIYQKLDEPLPPVVVEKMDQIRTLEDSIKNAIAKKEVYLEEAKADRKQLNMSMKQITEWLSGAEDMLDSGYDGLDYDTLNDTLSEHKDYFSEASMCQDEMEQVMDLSERLLPTLDNNDRETLRQTLRNTNQKLANVLAGSSRQQQVLEVKTDEWRDFQEDGYGVIEHIDQMEEEWGVLEHMPASTPDAVHKQTIATKEFLVKIDEMRPSINDLNDKARELEKSGNSVSRAMVNKLITEVNDRWNSLVCQTENKQMTMQDLGAQWEEYNMLVSGVETMLQDAQTALPVVDVENATSQDLISQLNETKAVCTTLDVSQPKIDALKRSAQNLQRNLPTAESKVQTQEQVMALLERLERITDQADEQEAVILEEIDDRSSFQNEADQTVAWLSETKQELSHMDPGKEVSDVMEKMEKQKVLEQEIAIRMEQMRHMGQLQETKYTTMGKDLPVEMKMQMANLRELEADVGMAMKAKEEELQHIKEDREEVTSALRDASAWLGEAELRLQERIINIPDSQHKHVALQDEFSEFKQVLDKLRTKGSDLIKHTPDSIEKQIVQKALADTNRQWLALQAKSAEHARKLATAEDLSGTFDEVAESVRTWLDSAESVVKAEPQYGHSDKLKEQLRQHRRLARDLDHTQGRLAHIHSLSKQMEEVCDASASRDELQQLNQRMYKLQTAASDKLGKLEDATDEVEDYETELTSLRQWMDSTRAQMTMRDASLTLKDQLALQEKLVEEIESNKGKALLVLQKQTELQLSDTDRSPRNPDKLAKEINQLQAIAREQCATLKEAVLQQELYEGDLQTLTAAINDAQDKLLASPVNPSDVDSLKKQIAEHNALANKIKSYQAKVNDINEKSQALNERSHQIGPDTAEKLCELGYYPSTLGAFKVPIRPESTLPDSGVSMSPRMSYDTTPQTFSEVDFSTSTLRSGRERPTPRSGDRPYMESWNSLSARSDDTDVLLDESLLEPMYVPQVRASRPSRSPVPHHDFTLDLSYWSKPGLHDSSDQRTSVRSSDRLTTPSREPAASPRRATPRSNDDRSQQRYKPLSMRSLSPSSSLQASPRQWKKPKLDQLVPYSDMDISASVPNLLQPAELVPRERSASFGSKLSRTDPHQPRPLGQSGPDSRLAQLNKSWNCLQQQLGVREQELQHALHKQERYQQCVQDVTTKMERAHLRLNKGFPSSLTDLDRQLNDYREVLQDIEGIKEDITRVRERGRQIVEVSDPEGYKAMQATLTMLSDRVESLQGMADNKGRQLQSAVKDKEKHHISLNAYKKRIKELDDWLDEMKIRQATTPLPSDTVDALKHNLHENQSLQDEINDKLQTISDLAVQCDNLCEMETPANAEKLKSQLTNLQTQLGNLKLASIEKRGPLRLAIKESERRKKEMDEYENNLKKLQQWVTDTKQMTMAPVHVEPLIIGENHSDLQQKLKSDLLQHRQLVRQISSDAAGHDGPDSRQRPSELPSVSEDDLRQRWEEISTELARRKQSLTDMLHHRDSRDGGRGYPGGQGYPGFLPTTETSGQLKDVRQSLAELSDLWGQLQTQVEDRQVRLDRALEFQQKYQDALQSISSWLDLAEQKLFSPDADMDASQQVQENEALQREIKLLQNEISLMGRTSQELLSSVNKDSQSLVTDSLANLNSRVQILEEQARNQGDKLRQVDKQAKHYQDDMRALQKSLAEMRAAMVTSPSTSLDQLITNMQKIEAQMKKCERQLEDLKKKGQELSSLAPQMVSPTELNALQSSYRDLRQKVMDKKADLLQSVSVQEQYEKMLLDYAEFLETAQDKLKSDAICARDLDSLKQQLAAHKDFFGDLEVHRAMLDSLATQTDQATQAKHAPRNSRLTNLTYVIQDKASLFGQKLDRLVRQWTELDEKHVHLERFLDTIEEEVPTPVSSSDSIMTIQDKMSTYKRLQQEITEEKPILYQVVDKGKQLLHSITCPTLENAVTEAGERWVTLTTSISHELKKTETLGGQLQQFEGEATVFRSWLCTAKLKLGEIKHLSDQDQHSIAAIRSKVDRLLEFRKEVEVQIPLKNKIIAVGNQLSQNATYSTTDLETRLAWFEDQWGLLQHDIGKAEECLHTAQMDLMPSRQALHELGAWLTEMEELLTEEKQRPLKDLADIEILLKKFKDLKIELQNKQLTIDFVNQSALQTSSTEGEDVPLSADKTDFAERLGHLNKRWQSLNQDVSGKLKMLEMMHSKWAEYNRALLRVQEWFYDQEDKVKRYRLIGHEVSIRQTLKDCKILEQSLASKEGDIQSVKALGLRLVALSEDSPHCQKNIQSSMDNLDAQWRHLSQQVKELEAVLHDFLNQWQAYSKELQTTNQILSETDYCLGRYNLVGGDITTLRMQVDKLRSLCGEVERGTTGYDRFVTLGNQLIQVCEVPVRKEIQKTLADVTAKWSRTCGELQDRTSRFEDCLQQWQQYEEEYSYARRWLDTKERQCNELVAIREDSSRREECLQQSKALQRELDNFQSRLSSLYQLSDTITKNIDTASIVGITSRQSAIEARVMALRQILAKQVQLLQGDLSQKQRFKDLFTAITMFLAEAEKTLGEDDLPSSSDEQALQDRYEEIKYLTLQFSNNMPQLDALNDLGYRMALSEESSLELRQLNHMFQRLYSETKEQNKMLQGIILVQQDFTEKCDAWMTFLAQTEQDLSTEIAGNLADLIDQQRKCEKFESDMYTKQQILHAIISDGQRMMKEGKVEDKEEFQLKLHLLAEQWQSVVRRANQRKAIIDNTIKQWQAFNELTERLRDWLTEKEFGLKSFEVDLVSLQKIKNLLDKARHMQTEFKLQEDVLKKVHEQSQVLLHRADSDAADEIKVCTAHLQQYWHQLYGRLDDQCTKLEAVLKQWEECEEDIEDILTWLKDTRQSVTADLPTVYDQLQAQLHKCRDIESEFANAEVKRDALLAKEKRLGEVIQPDDLNVLHQRIRLLNKQWDELRNQASLRVQRINDNMFRWSSFNERIRDLMEWIDQMEVKVISTKEYHIEDLLTKMQKDFREEMADKEREKNRLVDQGNELMKVSSEVRSDDIDNKIQRLDEKWQHLSSVLNFRQRKLQETLLAVQQLDLSMANLRKWLSSMEHDLSGPIIYEVCHRHEIQEKLRQQQELQTDIEHHSAGVGSVLNLCQVLLHDTDACPTEVEFNALQTAMNNLDRRWRTICQLSPERRARIEETWELWQALLEECKAFDDWLTDTEQEVIGSPREQLDVSLTREEVKHFESLQKRVHENLVVLENINRQYRRLAREGRTDHANHLKQEMQDANNRWDKLQQCVSAMTLQLKQSSSLHEDFTSVRDSLYTWLNDVDMQLTNIEHLSSMDTPTKMAETMRLQDDIEGKKPRLDYLDQSALYLIQKGDNLDAALVQKELDDFKVYSRQVVDRVNKYHKKLHRMVEDEEKAKVVPPSLASVDEIDMLERQLKAPEYTLDLDLQDLEAYLEASPPESPPEKRRAAGRGILQARPLSPVRSSALRRSRSPKRSPSPLRTTRGRSPYKENSPSRYAHHSPIRSPRMVSPSMSDDSFTGGRTRDDRKQRKRHEVSLRSREAKVENMLESLVEALEDAKHKLRLAEREMRCSTPTGPRLDQGRANYGQHMSECEQSVDVVRTLDRLAKSETGLAVIPSADEEVMNVLQRWERLQAQAIEKDYRVSQHRQDWGQFRTDLDNMLAWLDEAETLQTRHTRLPDDIVQLDSIIRQHKDFLVQLESKKTRVLSINLISKNFIDMRTDEGRMLRDKLNLMNRRWEAMCAHATTLQQELQGALMQCQEFHHTIHDLLLWLENVETKLQQNEPINLGVDHSALWSKLKKLKEIRSELQNNQPRVTSLRETADQLLMNTDSTEMVNAKDKMHIISNRLRALLRLCSSYIISLEDRLQIHPHSKTSSPAQSLDVSCDSQMSDISTGSHSFRSSTPRHTPRFRPGSFLRNRTRSPLALSRQLLFGLARPLLGAEASHADNLTGPRDEDRISAPAGLLRRALWAALPLQILFLVLLGIASLVPMTEEDYSCDLVNNFRRSLGPMLRYMDGPPPT